MIVALRAMRDGAADDTREIVDRVLAKLEAAAAEGPAAARIDPGVDTREPRLAALADRLRDAAERHVQVQLTYYVPSRDEESERLVDPRGVVTAHGMTYLDAWCHSAEAPRLFRIDRIASAVVTDRPIETPIEAPRDLSEGIFAQSDVTALVTLRLAPPARWVVEYYPVEAVRPPRRRHAGGRPAGGGRPLAAPPAAPPGPPCERALTAGVRPGVHPPDT